MAVDAIDQLLSGVLSDPTIEKVSVRNTNIFLFQIVLFEIIHSIFQM